MSAAPANELDRAGLAVASLGADRSVRLAATIGSPTGALASLPGADAALVARCGVLAAAARGLSGAVGAGGVEVFCVACDEGNVVLGLTRDGAGLLVVAAPGANLGLTLARVRSAIECDVASISHGAGPIP